MAAWDAWDCGCLGVCKCWAAAAGIEHCCTSPNVLPECHVPAGLGVLGLQRHPWVSDSLSGMSSAVSTASVESQTHRIIYFGKRLQDHQVFALAGREGGNSSCVEAEGESCHLPEWAGGEARQATCRSKNVPAALSIQIGEVSSPQIHIHDPLLCFASWQLQRGRHKGGRKG